MFRTVSGNKQNALIRLGMERGAAVQPLWQGVSLVVDEFTRAAYGEIIVHAVLLANFAITRKAQFSTTPAGSTPPRPMAQTYQGTHGESLCAPIELRESEGGPMLHGCLVQEGRAASVRPGSFRAGQSPWFGPPPVLHFAQSI